MKTEVFNDTTIIIGQNAQENWNIIDFNSGFIWLHLNSYPSCHVIIKDDNPSQETLMFAAELCKENTKYRNLRNLKVCYTTCNNLKKGPDVGSIIYKSNRQVKTILV
jgi:predicted ribosome quality control (RQC) complex YloA/Tae2 family protein